jgi:uncharacterized protein YbjT (DUF2867 family)
VDPLPTSRPDTLPATAGASSDGPVFVTGATGPHGGAVARALLAASRGVRARTRNPTSGRATELAALGAELVEGDLLDPAALTDAMRGVGVACAVTTPSGDGPAAEIEQGEQIIAAASAAGLPWLVLASVASADRATGVPHCDSKRQIEQKLEASQPARSADLAAMYRFLTETGYEVDIAGVRAGFPDARWTSFAQWAAATGSSSQ